MDLVFRYGCRLIIAIMVICQPLQAAELGRSSGGSPRQRPYASFRLIGHIESDQLVECSGMDVSKRAADDLVWAINDGGNGPFVYALGLDGRDRGRVRILGIDNRDWEGMDTFVWQGRAMILIADFGDNERQYDSHSIFVVEEPRVNAERLSPSVVAEVAWRIDFRYPDGPHDAEGVAVDTTAGEVLVLTKRDVPPLLFTVPLKPTNTQVPVTAQLVAQMNRIPPPTEEDRRHPYGDFRSQPTAMDLSTDGRLLVVLTYKHAYQFSRSSGKSWTTAVNQRPTLIRLPLPQNGRNLHQREAICFAGDERSLLVTSEGLRSGIFQINIR